MRAIYSGVLLSLLACGPAPIAKPPATTPPTLGNVVQTPPTPGPLDGALAILLTYGAYGMKLCAALPQGSVRCLGSNVGGDLMLDRPIRSLVHGLCATDTDGGVACVNHVGAWQRLAHLRGRRDLSRIATSTPEMCALADDGTVSCVLLDDSPGPPPFGLSADAAVRALSPHCAITMKNDLRCQDPKLLAPYAKEIGTWTSIATGTYERTSGRQSHYKAFAVGLGADRRVHSAGENFLGELGNGGRGRAGVGVVLDKVDEVAASNTHVCARTGGRVACWGESTAGQVAPAARETIPACQVDTAASLAAYKRSIVGQREAFQRCVAAASSCTPPQTDCLLGCRPPSEESKTVPPWSYIYVQTPAGCLEQPEPSTRTVEPAPVFFPDIDDARQLTIWDGMTCILRATGATRCFGRLSGVTLDAAGTPH